MLDCTYGEGSYRFPVMTGSMSVDAFEVACVTLKVTFLKSMMPRLMSSSIANSSPGYRGKKTVRQDWFMVIAGSRQKGRKGHKRAVAPPGLFTRQLATLVNGNGNALDLRWTSQLLREGNGLKWDPATRTLHYPEFDTNLIPNDLKKTLLKVIHFRTSPEHIRPQTTCLKVTQF